MCECEAKKPVRISRGEWKGSYLLPVIRMSLALCDRDAACQRLLCSDICVTLHSGCDWFLLVNGLDSSLFVQNAMCLT